MKINRDSLDACTVLLPVDRKTNLVLIGCGGTGSWLAPHIVRTAMILQNVFDHEVQILFWDGDSVQEKNIYRQNFCSAEIGLNKAETLAARYGQAWGIEVIAVPEFYVSSSVTLSNYSYFMSETNRTIVITCVDDKNNNAARKAVYAFCEHRTIWWLDTGNRKTAGQIALGRQLYKGEKPILGTQTMWLPLPSLQFPEMFKPTERRKKKIEYQNMSCAELALIDEQGTNINQAVASAAASMLNSLLITGDLAYHCAYVSNRSGISVVYNTPKLLRRYIRLVKNVS